MSALGKRSQAVQRERRIAAIDPDELAAILTTPVMCDGTPIASFQWQDFRTGKIRRWTVLRGNRCNNYRLRTPDGRQSRAHGLAWCLAKVRRVILRQP